MTETTDSRTSAELSHLHVQVVGLTPDDVLALESYLSHCQVRFLEAKASLIMEPLNPKPNIVLCGVANGNLSLVEMAQLLRNVYPDIPILGICTDRDLFDREILIKNGFTDVFLLPMDRETLVQGFQNPSPKRPAAQSNPSTRQDP